jgi:hypothetical protein
VPDFRLALKDLAQMTDQKKKKVKREVDKLTKLV